MSWNKPSSVPQPPPKKSAPPSLKRGLLAGLVVVALGALGLYLFSGGEADSRPLQKKDRGRIKEVTPAAAPTNNVAAQPPVVKSKKPWWDTDKTNGFSRTELREWKHRHTPPAYVARRDRRKKAPFAIFDHPSENLIASYLVLQPGQGLIGTPNLKGVEEDFLESLKTPIIPTSEDSEEVADLKRAMNRTKIEIKERLDAGEKLADILLESHKEAQRLAQFKMTLQQELAANLRKDASKEEVEDFVAAANRILADKGIAPIKAGPIIRRKLAMDYSARKGDSKGTQAEKDDTK